MGHKDFNYYSNFVEMIGFCVTSSLLLKDSFINYNHRTLELKLKEIHRIEQKADQQKHNTMERLAIEFIAPIEREDIVLLSQAIDDITDGIEDIFIKLHMYHITRIKPEASQFTQLIVQCCMTLQKALEEFHAFKKSTKLKPLLIEVNHLEETGDQLYCDAMHQLFSNSNDSRELLIWSKIFEHFETCINACEHVSDTMERIIIKNT